ncbi:amidohydrolase family protein [Alkaliphilus peptidifermentans]|uniref:Imidazolonepropionase n=1 Tax=Alkaliphilus peptidifermentans DSM 18978 TaxID=1120976 RepID=A0A1G5L1P7_9FIRM|nr:amidohydrolase family protein [Alkaliphilus peptidifermentans]SCZ06812.1 Imidazolonepropionase [Alkaliphilus peptidifermentans DSM 18978]
MFIIKNGIIHIGNGDVLKDWDILIEDGLIKRIEKNIEIENSKTINAKGREVFPGFIDPISNFGCMDSTFSIKDHDEISNPITPDAKIKYAFNPSEIMLEELYKVGITAIGAAPGNKNIIGGQMAAFKTWGSSSKKMLIKEPVALKGAVSNPVKESYGKNQIFPMTRMGIFSKLENYFYEAAKSNEDNIVKRVLNKEIPLVIHVNTSAEIQALLNIVKDYDLHLVICGGYQADRCIEEIIHAKASVIVGEQTYLTAKNYNETDLKKIADIQKEGGLVSFSLTGDYGPEGKVKYLWNAIGFYRAGVDREDVLKMMTINPAKILGLDHILGTIEVGKSADLVIYTNNPIEYYSSRAVYTFIGGEMVYQEGDL